MNKYNVFRENVRTLKDVARVGLQALLFGSAMYVSLATADHYINPREYKESFKDNQVIEYSLIAIAIFGAGLELSRKKR